MKNLISYSIMVVAAVGFSFSAVTSNAMSVSKEQVRTRGPVTKVRMEVEVPRPGGAAVTQLDILFVIDDSGSMDPQQAKLLKNVDQLVRAAKDSGVDIHAAVITTNMDSQPWNPKPGETWHGEFAGAGKKVAATAEGDFEQVLTDNLKAAMTTTGSGNEQPFLAIQNALSEPLLSTVNQGFLRPDAGLATFVLTDADDQSPMHVSDFVTFLKNLKSKAPVALHAAYIPTTAASTCDRSGENVPARIEEALTAFGTLNESVSLCDEDFGTKVTQIGKVYEATGLRTVQLKVVPLVSTMKITYGTETLDAGDLDFGWVYDARKLQLKFGDKIDWTTEAVGTPLVIQYEAK